MNDLLILDRFLPYRLSVLSNTVSTAIANRYTERFDLRIPEWRVLAVLGMQPGLSAAEVAAKTAMDAVAVSRAVTRLLKQGRLERSYTSQDRRRSELRLSEHGQRVYEEIVPIARAYERALLDGLDDTQRLELDRLLQMLTQRANRLTIQPPTQDEI
ncbi:MAG: MarR family winged helix-turn-helix transcriptional regulator [Acidibacter sp.]|jgi:DNA-binding MarR family transcriptional regulator|nr:MarR family winged helix-turn-helix transcriptional regulator [Acidibacter sp.]